MKISAIKTILQAPIKKIFPCALGAMALVGCTEPIGKIKEYCEEYDIPAIEYNECVNKCEGTFSAKNQAILDSLVYRGLLNGTKLANDSNVILDFNRICATYRYGYSDNEFVKFDDNLLKSGMTTKEYKNIYSKVTPTGRQFETDKTLFGRLFRDRGLMTEDFARKFIAVSKFLDPTMNYDVKDIDRIKNDVSDSELIDCGVSVKAKNKYNVLNIKSIDRSGEQKNIISIETEKN